MKAKGIIYIPFGILSITTATAGVVLASAGTFADESTVTTTVTVLEACSMTKDASASTAHEISMVGGRSEQSVGLTTIDVTCNDREGYSVYVMGVDGTAQANSDTNLTGQTSGQVITTGTDMSTTTDSHWAMRLAANNDSTTYWVPTIVNGFDSNHVVPASYTKAVTFQNGIDVSKPSRFTTTYAIAITPYQLADTYVGHVKYLLVHPNYKNADGTFDSSTYTVASANTSNTISIDGVTYTNGQTPSLVIGKTYTITANIDTENYHFVSWSAQGGTLGDSTAATTTFRVEGGDTRTLTLDTAMNCNSTVSGTMQDFNPCSTLTGSGTLTDTRGGVTKSYTVAKLADGKWWMTSNLNLPGGTTLSSTDSDVPSANYYTLPASTAISSGTSVPSDQFSDNTGQYVFNTGNETTTCNSSTPCNSYYSWLVATAGGKDASGNDVTGNGYNTAYSICPKGWRLPTSTTSDANAQTSPNWKTGDWYALATAYGANLESQYYENAVTFYNNAGPGTTPNFLLAGYYGSGTFDDGGTYGYYWSATSYSSTYGYYLYFGSGYVYSANYSYRRYGFSVRCVYGD